MLRVRTDIPALVADLKGFNVVMFIGLPGLRHMRAKLDLSNPDKMVLDTGAVAAAATRSRLASVGFKIRFLCAATAVDRARGLVAPTARRGLRRAASSAQ